MAIGDTANVDLTTKKLEIIFDTGVVGDKPVLDRVYIPVAATISTQDAYDMAYALAEYSSYNLYGIEMNIVEVFGPIN